MHPRLFDLTEAQALVRDTARNYAQKTLAPVASRLDREARFPREQLAGLALRHAMPTMHQFREFPRAGGLMGYGGSITDSYRLVVRHSTVGRPRGRLRPPIINQTITKELIPC